MKIRNIEEKDIEKVYNIGITTKQFRVSNKTTFYSKEELKNWIKNKGPGFDIMLVAEEDNKILGFLLCDIHRSNVAYLDCLVVSEKERNKGIGTKLLKSCLEKIRNKNIKYIWGIVGIDYKETRNFWKRKDFKEGEKFVFIEKYLK